MLIKSDLSALILELRLFLGADDSEMLKCKFLSQIVGLSARE